MGTAGRVGTADANNTTSMPETCEAGHQGDWLDTQSQVAFLGLVVRASSLPRLPNEVNMTSARPDSSVATVPPRKQPMLPELARTLMSERRPATELL